ncbi:MAG: glycosyltransferase family 4 protein [Terrimicrobiaceae bacterium]|nr:glycosyltransferase family 4 protein [Terrimicrobiaceae bacterium]
MLRVHFTAGDGAGWALDEDLRQIRQSLKGRIVESGPWAADVIHAAFWQNLSMVSDAGLRDAYVVAHADNPPFFYVRQPEFGRGQRQVDLWIARSREALGQFRQLGLPVEHIPYTIDPGLFFPIPDRAALREEFGLPRDAYVIANFHRDTEGADLRSPKVQKAPELLVAILRRLKTAGCPIHVLLAGPRRHWIRGALEQAGVPFTFVGRPGIAGDDFRENILDRKTLNRLYNAADLFVVPSRWEGGPQAVMEAAAARCKILSTRLGVARDILEPESLFAEAGEAFERIRQDIERNVLTRTLEIQHDRFKAEHTTARLESGLRSLYDRLEADVPPRAPGVSKRARGFLREAAHTFHRRTTRSARPKEVGWSHRSGHDSELDDIMEMVARALTTLGIRRVEPAPGRALIIGYGPVAVGAPVFQFCGPGGLSGEVRSPGLILVPSVQDLLNLRENGVSAPALVFPYAVRAESAASGEPFLVKAGDRSASLRVWEALGSGRPVVYPANSAYYEQVFHAGVAYVDDPAQAIALAAANSRELRALSKVPDEAALAGFLLKVLAIYHG